IFVRHDLLFHFLEQQPSINRAEEILHIRFNSPPEAVGTRRDHVLHSHLYVSSLTKCKTAIQQQWLHQRLNRIQNSALGHTIPHRQDTQLPLLTVLLGNGHKPRRHRLVTTTEQTARKL